MKHLLFALLFITSLASAQTGNYTHDVTNPTGTSNQTYLMDVGIDTLHDTGSGSVTLNVRDETFTYSDGYIENWMIEMRVYNQ